MPTLRTLLATLLFAQATLATAAPLTVTSSDFKDGGTIPKAQIGLDAKCGTGQNQSPEVSWKHLPEGTKSVAVLILDPDGAKGLGVSHWVVYNVDAKRGGLKAGEANASSEGITVGKNIAGAEAYRGPCPPAGDLPHHYNLTVIATDLEPGKLPAGLDRQGLLDALKDHALGAMSVVGLYGH